MNLVNTQFNELWRLQNSNCSLNCSQYFLIFASIKSRKFCFWIKMRPASVCCRLLCVNITRTQCTISKKSNSALFFSKHPTSICHSLSDFLIICEISDEKTDTITNTTMCQNDGEEVKNIEVNVVLSFIPNVLVFRELCPGYAIQIIHIIMVMAEQDNPLFKKQNENTIIKKKNR